MKCVRVHDGSQSTCNVTTRRLVNHGFISRKSHALLAHHLSLGFLHKEVVTPLLICQGNNKLFDATELFTQAYGPEETNDEMQSLKFSLNFESFLPRLDEKTSVCTT